MPIKTEDLLPVPGWLTVPEAAVELGITKQAVHKQIETGKWRTVRRLGKHTCVEVLEVEEKKLAALDKTQVN